MNPRSTDCDADALTTTPPRRSGFNSFLLVHMEHNAASSCRWHLPFVAQSVKYGIPFAFSKSFLVTQSRFFQPHQNRTLLLARYYYPSSKYVHTITLQSPWPVQPKHLPYQLMLLSSATPFLNQLNSLYCPSSRFSSSQNTRLILPQTQCLALKTLSSTLHNSNKTCLLFSTKAFSFKQLPTFHKF